MWSCAACGQRWTIRLRSNWFIRSVAWVMFSKRPRRQSPNPRSIASQLILLFTLAAALLLACGLGVFYWVVVRHAFAEDNAVLADKMFALSADLRENGPEIFAEEITARRAGQHTPYWIRVLDSQGRAI